MAALNASSCPWVARCAQPSRYRLVSSRQAMSRSLVSTRLAAYRPLRGQVLTTTKTVSHKVMVLVKPFILIRLNRTELHLLQLWRTPPWLASGWECRGRRPSRVYGGPVPGAWSKSTLRNLSTASRKVGQAHKPSLCTAALAFSSVVCEIRMAERPQASPLQSHELQLTW